MAQEIKRNIPRDLFLHLLAIVTLYWSSISFVTLIWQFINKFYPDTLNYYYSGDYALSLIRFSVSALVIVFPVFILVSWYLNKIYRRELEVRSSKIRKWLIYLTLFIASLVIIGDLIFVINTFLGGEITARFVLKALSIIFVAGIILGYYLDDVRREKPAKSSRYFAWISSILVLSVIISAFIMAGSPNSARLIQFDQQKVSDLQGIQYQIVNYWQRKGMLPVALSDLNDTISGYNVPVDPQTGANYEYYATNLTKITLNSNIINNPGILSFQLCATFNKQSTSQSLQPMAPVSIPTQLGGVSQNWNHTAGRVCFERTIDRQLYPLLNTAK